ncbi:MAG: hypothetical protein ACRYGP_13845 [Janthinobacterium lividum]
MSLFAAAAAVGAVAQDLVYGETIGFEPQVNGPAAEFVAAGADPNRIARDLVGIYDSDLAVARPVGSGANTHDSIDVAATAAQVDFALGLFATEADQPVEGDHLVLKDRVGLPRVKVLSARPDNFGRLLCLVAPLG